MMESLDVGCGCHPKGEVNVNDCKEAFNPQDGFCELGFSMNPKVISNFVLADAHHLPFKNDAFNFVFSSHVIEHVKYPELMLQEMIRVAYGFVVVRCPHKRGSGAKRPFHVNYLDEKWFISQGLEFEASIPCYDYPFTNRLKLPKWFKTSFLWRVIRHVEWLTQKVYPIPLELEVKIKC